MQDECRSSKINRFYHEGYEEHEALYTKVFDITLKARHIKFNIKPFVSPSHGGPWNEDKAIIKNKILLWSETVRTINIAGGAGHLVILGAL